jgi:hypothetical protein
MERRTENTKLSVAFRKFAKAPKMPHVLRHAKCSYQVRYVANISYRVTVWEETERIMTSSKFRLKKKAMLSECWQNWKLYAVYMSHFLCFCCNKIVFRQLIRANNTRGFFWIRQTLLVSFMDGSYALRECKENKTTGRAATSWPPCLCSAYPI